MNLADHFLILFYHVRVYVLNPEWRKSILMRDSTWTLVLELNSCVARRAENTCYWSEVWNLFRTRIDIEYLKFRAVLLSFFLITSTWFGTRARVWKNGVRKGAYFFTSLRCVSKFGYYNIDKDDDCEKFFMMMMLKWWQLKK